ncbi:MAG: RNA 2',3'-cyclic phosphodiesterase [Sinobacteraceae bacterium]|nr:RNA 2',3'-cyclic phosphodiesterase [Nevskiaceae bacterium]
MNRLFFALLPTALERGAAQIATREIAIRHPPTGLVVPSEDFHVTLLFLGTLTDEQQLAAQLAGRAVACGPFALRFELASCFKNRDLPWWIGCRTTVPQAQTLRDALHDALLKTDIPLPRRMTFVPHITIRRREVRVLAPTPVTPFEWQAGDFALVRSHPARTVGRYEIVERFALRERPAEASRPEPDQLSLL